MENTKYSPAVYKPPDSTLSLWGLLTGIIVATIYALQLHAMLDSNNINRDALESVQRAFVLSGTVEPTVVGPKGSQSTIFGVHWDNSGSTPARGTTHVSYRWDQAPLPEDYSFPDLWDQGQPHFNTPFVLGPKGTMSVPIGPIATPIIDGIVEHRIHLNVFGWAKYRDVFKDTPEHLSEFCIELIPIDVQTEKDSGLRTVKYRFDNCLHHNCYDDDCKIEK